MQANRLTVNVCNPRGDTSHVAQIPIQARLSSLSGKRLAILNNGKPGGEMLLPYLEAALKKRLKDIEFRSWRVLQAEPDEEKKPKLEAIAQWGDAVIALTGD